jgi:hypothetical protein
MRCDYCYRPGVCLVTRRRNTFWRALFGLPKPHRRTCIDHLMQASQESW